MPHLNNKQNKNTNPIISRQEGHLTQPCPSEENKQINKQKLAQISPDRNLTETTGPTVGGAETKMKKEFSREAWEKQLSNTKVLKNNNDQKAEKY